MIDLVYVSWNRLRYSQLSFGALLANTDWNHVARLILADDASTDGTREWLEDTAPLAGVPYEFLPAPFRGPVDAINRYLDEARSDSVAVIGKIDNDTMVPPGWLAELLGLLERYPDVDLLGMRPDIGPPEPCPYEERGVRYAAFVDGNGLWRLRTFDGRPRPRSWGSGGRQGFSEWQQYHGRVIKAWAAPDLPVFQLDGLPFEPWLSLAQSYVQQGWQRGWPNALYAEDADAYWSWWEPDAAYV